jgi:hypothetical protein
MPIIFLLNHVVPLYDLVSSDICKPVYIEQIAQIDGSGPQISLFAIHAYIGFTTSFE